jgi:hypothetical protein
VFPVGGSEVAPPDVRADADVIKACIDGPGPGCACRTRSARHGSVQSHQSGVHGDSRFAGRFRTGEPGSGQNALRAENSAGDCKGDVGHQAPQPW